MGIFYLLDVYRNFSLDTIRRNNTQYVQDKSKINTQEGLDMSGANKLPASNQDLSQGVDLGTIVEEGASEEFDNDLQENDGITEKTEAETIVEEQEDFEGEAEEDYEEEGDEEEDEEGEEPNVEQLLEEKRQLESRLEDLNKSHQRNTTKVNQNNADLKRENENLKLQQQGLLSKRQELTNSQPNEPMSFAQIRQRKNAIMETEEISEVDALAQAQYEAQQAEKLYQQHNQSINAVDQAYQEVTGKLDWQDVCDDDLFGIVAPEIQDRVTQLENEVRTGKFENPKKLFAAYALVEKIGPSLKNVFSKVNQAKQTGKTRRSTTRPPDLPSITSDSNKPKTRKNNGFNKVKSKLYGGTVHIKDL